MTNGEFSGSQALLGNPRPQAPLATLMMAAHQLQYFGGRILGCGLLLAAFVCPLVVAEEPKVNDKNRAETPPASLPLLSMPGKSHEGPLPPLTDAEKSLAEKLETDVKMLAT